MHQPSSNPFCPFWTPLWISPARQCRPVSGPGHKRPRVWTRIGAVHVRGFVFLGLCCLFQIGAGLSSVSMAPLVIVCSSIRGAPTVFKSVLPVLNATLDQPGTASQTRHRPGPKRARCRLRVERCVCVFWRYFECAACFRLVQGCPESACYHVRVRVRLIWDKKIRFFFRPSYCYVWGKYPV